MLFRSQSPKPVHAPRLPLANCEAASAPPASSSRTPSTNAVAEVFSKSVTITALKSVLDYPFTCARDSFNQIIEEQEMTGQTRDILLGNLTEKELTSINSEKLIDARDKMRDVEDIILREFRIIELTEILINKLKLIGYNIEEIKQENWETPKGFIASINKFD